MNNNGHPDSWYRSTVTLDVYPQFEGHLDCDVAIIGAGYTGLGAAIELALKGVRVVVLEASEIGSGASGRNGGQIHTGQRLEPLELEAQLGFDGAKALWDMAEDAKSDLFRLINAHQIECDLKSGLIHATHKPRFVAEMHLYADYVQKNYGYSQTQYLSRSETAGELGTDVYFGGLLDKGAGHLNPLKLVLGMARAAKHQGAKLYAHSRVLSYHKVNEGHRLDLGALGTLKCQTLLLCGNGYMGGLDRQIDLHVLPINNFILTTEPLVDVTILKNDVAVADSRFVVNYFRKTPDNRLLFGGGENYVPWFPKDIKAFVRNNMLKIYPHLKDIKISHGWGGTLAITLNRAPFVREVSPQVFTAAGFSGQGVVLAPYFGKLLAKAVTGSPKDIELLSQLRIPPFPGGHALKWPLTIAGLSYYALLDRL
jgi:gamma-glutamylputrescine oxidase